MSGKILLAILQYSHSCFRGSSSGQQIVHKRGHDDRSRGNDRGGGDKRDFEEVKGSDGIVGRNGVWVKNREADFFASLAGIF